MKVKQPAETAIREIVTMFPAIPSTPAVPAMQQASCSLSNELFTSTAEDQKPHLRVVLGGVGTPRNIRDLWGFCIRKTGTSTLQL